MNWRPQALILPRAEGFGSWRANLVQPYSACFLPAFLRASGLNQAGLAAKCLRAWIPRAIAARSPRWSS